MSTAKLLQPGVWCQIGIAHANGRDLIGDIGLILASNSMHAEIGFTLRRESQGHGLATAAVKGTIELVFEMTRAAKVVGIADARNVASTRLLQRAGMRKMETRPAKLRGEPCTEHVYAIHKHPAD